MKVASALLALPAFSALLIVSAYGQPASAVLDESAILDPDIIPQLVPPNYNCSKPKIVPGEGPYYTPDQFKKMMMPDLVWGGAALTSQRISAGDDGTVELKILGAVDNLGRCDADESRMKAVLKFSGGKWLGEGRVDKAVPRLSTELVEFSFTLSLDDVAKDCTLNRDDWVVTLSADFREVVTESDEKNNQYAIEFSTASDNFCTRSREEDRRFPDLMDGRRLGQ